ncbi:MAG: acetolactate decarboxylase [Alphaproteobacteria bacterium]|nr:acetolactate decarboxylase [Alphaproteobacteria bacterium]
MKHLKFYFVAILFSSLLILSCGDKGVDNALKSDVYQIGRYDSLFKGHYEGLFPLIPFSVFVNFGIGLSQNLTNDITILNSSYYFANSQNQIRAGLPMVSDSGTYVVGCIFKNDTMGNITGKIINLTQLQASIKRYLKDTINTIYAIKVTGNIDSVKIRTFKTQANPYPILDTARKYGTVSNAYNTSGTLIGFYFPKKYSGSNNIETGFYFHYLSDDKKLSGNLLGVSFNGATVEAGGYGSLNTVSSYSKPQP